MGKPVKIRKKKELHVHNKALLLYERNGNSAWSD
jgi:hypothetical protein